MAAQEFVPPLFSSPQGALLAMEQLQEMQRNFQWQARSI